MMDSKKVFKGEVSQNWREVLNDYIFIWVQRIWMDCVCVSKVGCDLEVMDGARPSFYTSEFVCIRT